MEEIEEPPLDFQALTDIASSKDIRALKSVFPLPCRLDVKLTGSLTRYRKYGFGLERTTSLHVCVVHSFYEGVEYLLDRGHSPNLADFHVRTTFFSF